MRTVSLSGSPRAGVGRKDAADLRNAGKVPCVLYGGKEQIHFAAEERDFKTIIYTPEACVVELNIDGKSYRAIVQATQFHKLNDRLTHVDFLELVEGKAVTMAIPVKLNGQSKGVREGGKLVLKLRKLNVRGNINNIPQYIDIDITELGIGKSVSIGDIKIEGVTLLHPSNISVVSVQTTRNVVAEETPAAGGATPAAPAADKKAAAPAKK